MGYYTNHSLTIQDLGEHTEKEIFDYLYENEDVFYGLDVYTPSVYYDCSGSDCKWYEHQEDMKELAKKFPTATFVLHGEGEEQGDIWEEMYHGKDKIRRDTVQAWGDWYKI